VLLVGEVTQYVLQVRVGVVLGCVFWSFAWIILHNARVVQTRSKSLSSVLVSL
jgi:hypothetical protein